ncbi:MAG: peptidylprolyl isomerase [Spiribacter salinus]|uniref:peptidylprolyl isomerase n=1 Tax=Spiribacter salinus TaxID=1335746 RepID=A0A540VVR5_9GAMM|nr:MAG: peptidylprolyl isomerase [Spiribacter salinus]
MMKQTVQPRLTRLLTTLALLAVAGTPLAQDEGDVVAEINGEPINELELNQLVGQQTGGETDLPAVQRRQFLEEIINLVLLAQAGEEAGLELNPELQAQITNNRRRALAQSFVRENTTGDPIDEDTLRARYEDQYGGEAPREYRARHILVGEREQAQGLIDRLNDGEAFEALAEQHSQDGSSDNGGDLGWFTPGDMVEPFSEAVTGLSEGELTQTPVQTGFGWHVIRLDETREGEAPAFEDVADELRMGLINRRIQDRINALRESADIDYEASWAEPTD